MNQKRKRNGGFTLVEIMLVLGIIAILMGSTIYLLTGNLETARIKRVEADLAAISTQLSTYEMLNLTLPVTEQGLNALVEFPKIDPAPRRWQQLLKELPIDPWGHPYQYKNPGIKNPKKYDLYSLGADGIESDDDIGNWVSNK